MIEVGLEKVKPGMVLAEPVRNHQNRLLLDAGKKISARAIRIFKSWGITHIKVRSRHNGPPNQKAKNAPAAAEDIHLKLQKKFADSLDDPAMVKIMEAAGRILSRRLEREETADGSVADHS